MSDTLTIISHVYNEEYLLPFWLEQHMQIFDHGIIIDYCSSDRSVEIIKKYCPTWEVVKTKNLNSDGTPNFQAKLVDLEVNEIEQRVAGYKICLTTTEFLFITKPKAEAMKTLTRDKYYHVDIHAVMANKYNFFPKNAVEFFSSIELFGHASKTMQRGNRIIHAEPKLEYDCGRHTRAHPMGDNGEKDEFNCDAFFILWTKFYPCNHKMFERKLQVQNNIPQCDKASGSGAQHITDIKKLLEAYKTDITNHVTPTAQYPHFIKPHIDASCEQIRKNNVYYSELYVDSEWGSDYVMLNNDINLLKNTEFDNVGYKIIDIDDFSDTLRDFISSEINSVAGYEVDLVRYHEEITSKEHKQILNSMPYKKDKTPAIKAFSDYLEKTISDILNEPIKIFNGDLWFRICRPSDICDNDYNPCHRDVYLDFYRNIVNIYLPVAGSNEKSSLTICPGSHKWNENQTRVTKGGAHFKYQDKKYSVDAIVASKPPLEMVRPNPTANQLMLFSPYLVHGCATNENYDITRISLEVRFIRDDENGAKQEAEFNEFLKIRNWR